MTSKCGSMDNAKHKAGGGDVKVIFASKYVSTVALTGILFYNHIRLKQKLVLVHSGGTQ